MCDAFLHLLAFTALYAWVISLIYLLFTYIEFWFPDPATKVSGYALDSALSSWHPCLPRHDHRGLSDVRPGLVVPAARDPCVPRKGKADVRRWLSFLSLFVGAVTLMSDVICTVYYLVEGDLTTRFLLKVLVLFVVTGGIFLYLALVLRSESEATKTSARNHLAFAGVASLVVGLAVAWGFVLAGSPAARRIQLLDARRLEDLQTIVLAIESESVESSATRTADLKKQLKHPLPKTLEGVAKDARSEKLSIRDPETGEPYGYTVVNSSTFTPCAGPSRVRNAEYRVFWNHPAVTADCFTIDVFDPPP